MSSTPIHVCPFTPAATAEADGSITLDVCGQAAALLERIHVLDPAVRVATRLVTGDHAVVPPA